MIQAHLDHGASKEPMNPLWSVPLINYDLSNLGSLILIQITPKECTLEKVTGVISSGLINSHIIHFQTFSRLSFFCLIFLFFPFLCFYDFFTSLFFSFVFLFSFLIYSFSFLAFLFFAFLQTSQPQNTENLETDVKNSGGFSENLETDRPADKTK